MRHWISYEENLRGVYCFGQMCELYIDTVDKSEYPEFAGWLRDMERCGVFIRHQYDCGPCLDGALGLFWEQDDETEWSAYLFEDDADTEPAIGCHVEECNGFYNAEVEYKFWPYTEYKREQFATLEDAKAYCSSWAYFPEEG